VAGDDVIVFMAERFEAAFDAAFWTVYSSQEHNFRHGLGQLAKAYKSEGYKVDFLSKFGFRFMDQVVLNRQMDRALLSGNITSKIRKATRSDPGLTVAQHVAAITDGLIAWGKTWPIVSQLISYRQEVLEHQRGGSVGVDYSLLVHTNTHDYSYAREILLSFMNMPAVVYAESYIRRACDFIGSFESISG